MRGTRTQACLVRAGRGAFRAPCRAHPLAARHAAAALVRAHLSCLRTIASLLSLAARGRRPTHTPCRRGALDERRRLAADDRRELHPARLRRASFFLRRMHTGLVTRAHDSARCSRAPLPLPHSHTPLTHVARDAGGRRTSGLLHCDRAAQKARTKRDHRARQSKHNRGAEACCAPFAVLVKTCGVSDRAATRRCTWT